MLRQTLEPEASPPIIDVPDGKTSPIKDEDVKPSIRRLGFLSRFFVTWSSRLSRVGWRAYCFWQTLDSLYIASLNQFDTWIGSPLPLWERGWGWGSIRKFI